MTQNKPSGLGELLRYLSELLDQGSEAHYRSIGLDMRARYTPILRSLDDQCSTVTELQRRLRVTQGAISQTVSLMERDGLIRRGNLEDRRSQKLSLTPKGLALQAKLNRQWRLRFKAIEELERELGFPLRDHLQQAITALEKETFEERIRQVTEKLGG